ncbi:hypothetical protein IAQ61_002672 [Plenodomus lingam]|nr:hypothetical protein IAQ61_002672 [Plenodomus lingam]
MLSPEGQRAVLQLWANNTDVVVGPKEEPQAAFIRLAGVKGWLEGDVNWCIYWQSCFGEDYRRSGEDSVQATTTMQATPTSGKMNDDIATPPADLVERMRRLSVSSETSSFSIISAASSGHSVQSLDSNGSLTGGVQVLQDPQSKSIVLEKEKEKEKEKENAKENPASTTTAACLPPAPTTKANVEAAAGDKGNAEFTPTPSACPFWYQFTGFTPSPTAKFRDEFNRLAQHQKWSKNQRRKFQLQALKAEIAFHSGTCLQKLAKWQNLCEEMGVAENLPSINQCKMALKKVYVNLWNVIDHRRNPEIAIKRFKSRTQFCKAIRSGTPFPRDIAKQDGFINVLLRTI